MPIFFHAESQSTRAAVDRYFNKHVRAPYVYTQISTLGGANRASIIVKASLDHKETWANSIFQNSRYFMVRIERDGTMEMFSQHHKLPHMRKQRAISLIDAVARINKYIAGAR